MSAITHLPLGAYTIYGASLGGLYTSLHIPELDSLFDVGIPIRRAALASRLFLSHAHLDHLGSLPALLGMRGMFGGGDRPLDLYCPRGVEGHLEGALQLLSELHSWPLKVNLHPMEAGEERQLKRQLWVKALPTYHPVPSLGYLLFERVAKLHPDYHGRSGEELKELKRAGIEIHQRVDRPKVAYLTDTLPEALRASPEALDAEILILECTFVGEKKGVKIARAGCHIHLDELMEWAPQMRNKSVVLMHFSQVHQPDALRALFTERLGPILGDRLHLLLPQGDDEKRGDGWWI